MSTVVDGVAAFFGLPPAAIMSGFILFVTTLLWRTVSECVSYLKYRSENQLIDKVLTGAGEKLSDTAPVICAIRGQAVLAASPETDVGPQALGLAHRSTRWIRQLLHRDPPPDTRDS